MNQNQRLNLIQFHLLIQGVQVILTARRHAYWINTITFNVDIGIRPDPTIQQARVIYKLDVNHYRGNDNLQLLVDYLEPG
ncbi:hypothetical protein [Spongorhabdus nitratireducens]